MTQEQPQSQEEMARVLVAEMLNAPDSDFDVLHNYSNRSTDRVSVKYKGKSIGYKMDYEPETGDPGPAVVIVGEIEISDEDLCKKVRDKLHDIEDQQVLSEDLPGE